MVCDLLIRNCKALVQVRPETLYFLAGQSMADLPVLPDAFLAITQGRILDYGPMTACNFVGAEELDASGCFVFPSFVDSHTHLVYAASREAEFVLKIKGATYQEIAASGGGILSDGIQSPHGYDSLFHL